MTVNDLLTLGGAMTLVTIVVEVIKRAAALTPEATSRFGPLLSIVVGVAFCVGAGVAKGAALDEAALTGILAGAGASGIWSFAKGAGLRS